MKRLNNQTEDGLIWFNSVGKINSPNMSKGVYVPIYIKLPDQTSAHIIKPYLNALMSHKSQYMISRQNRIQNMLHFVCNINKLRKKQYWQDLSVFIMAIVTERNTVSGRKSYFKKK